MANKQLPDGRPFYHLELKDELKREDRNKYYSNLTALYNDNQLDKSLSFFQKRDWKTPYDSESFRIVKAKIKSTSQLSYSKQLATDILEKLEE